MQSVSFTVYGNPFGKQRPRLGRGHVYTPQETVDAENLVKTAAYRAMRNIKAQPFDGPLHCTLKIFCPIPESWSKVKKDLAADESMWHITKPDKDNVLKLCYDAMNKVVYPDDKQVVDGKQFKVYSNYPRVEITVSQLPEKRAL